MMPWTVLSDGWTEAPEAAALSGGAWRRRVRFVATAFLLRHPMAGPVLVDCGYSSRFFEETAHWPGNLYRWLTPVTLTEPGGIKAMLDAQGIPAESVRHLVITHFHADHIGGLRDFPNARLYCSEAAWRDVREVRGLAAVRRGFLPGLIPEDIEERLEFVSEGNDLFGDGLLKIVDLPGHAVGQIGLQFAEPGGRRVVLAADACWLSAAYRENRMPHGITRLLHRWNGYRATLSRLHQMHLADPNLLIVPSHCPETAARIKEHRPR